MHKHDYHESIRDSNHEKIRQFFKKNATKIYSISELQKLLNLHPKTLKSHLEELKTENIVKEIVSKPTLRLFQYNNNDEN